MRRLLLILVLLCLPVRADAAWAFVTGQTATASGNDQAWAFPSAAGSGNQILIFVSLTVLTNTVTIDGTPNAVTTIAGPIDDDGVASNIRLYVFCTTGDGADNSFTTTTSVNATANTKAIEFTGGTCTIDGTARSNQGTASPYNLTTDVTVSVCGSLVVGLIQSTTSATFVEATNYTLVLADNNAAAEYRITSATGDYDPGFTAGTSEVTFQMGVAIQPAAACAAGTAGYRSLLGVGK